MRLVIATSNLGKVREFRQMLGGDRFDWEDLTAHGPIPAPQETGLTFRANAMLKAAYYARHLESWSLADDSGLEVDALAGRPGVHSARWAEMHDAGSGDQANNQLLLRQLRQLVQENASGPHAPTAFSGWPDFSARFTCVLALSDPNGRIVLTTAGSVAGKIIESPRGNNGFGYDPLFLIDSEGKTTAELPPQDKHKISHRGEALRRMDTLLSSHRVLSDR